MGKGERGKETREGKGAAPWLAAVCVLSLVSASCRTQPAAMSPALPPPVVQPPVTPPVPVTVTPVPVHAAPVEVPGAVSVRASWPGSTPAENARRLAVPIETSVAGIPGISRILSRCDADGCVIVLSCKPEEDADRLARRVAETVLALRATMPEGSHVHVSTYDALAPPDMVFAVIPDPDRKSGGAVELAEVVAHRLAILEGVGRCRVEGERKPEFRISLDLDKCRAHGLVPQNVTDAIKAAAGEPMPQDGYVVRVPGDASGDALSRIILTTPAGKAVPLSEVAQVTCTTTTVPDTVVRLNGREAVLVNVHLARGATLRDVKARCEKAIKDNPVPGVSAVEFLESAARLP